MNTELFILINGEWITFAKIFAKSKSKPLAINSAYLSFNVPKDLRDPHSNRLSEPTSHQQQGCLLEWD